MKALSLSWLEEFLAVVAHINRIKMSSSNGNELLRTSLCCARQLQDTEMVLIEHSLLPLNLHSGRKINVLHGLGGIGKTQIAIAYTKKHQEVYSAMIWVNGDSKDKLLQSLAAFATYARIDGIQQLKVDLTTHGQETAEKAGAILQWLALERNRQWLVVFDNVDRDYYAEVYHFGLQIAFFFRL